MGKKGDLLDVLDTLELFEDYVENVEFKSLEKIGDMLSINLKNRILEERIIRMEDEIYRIREKVEDVEDVEVE